MQVEVGHAGEIDIVALRGQVGEGDIPEVVAAIQGLLDRKRLNLVLDLEGCTALDPAVIDAVGELGRTLSASGGVLAIGGGTALFGDALPRLKEVGDLVAAGSRGHAMAILLDRLSVRGELLEHIRQADATTYAAPHSPQPVVCRFVKNLQNFLVYALQPPYDGSLAKGMTLRFTMSGCGEDGTRTVSFDAAILRFAAMGETPCLVVKVPELLEVSEDRREEPRARVNYRCAYWEKGRSQNRSFGVMRDMSAEGASFQTKSFNFRQGQLIVLEIEFRRFKQRAPIHFEVLHRGVQAGEVVVGGRFAQIDPEDQAQIERMVLETSKW